MSFQVDYLLQKTPGVPGTLDTGTFLLKTPIGLVERMRAHLASYTADATASTPYRQYLECSARLLEAYQVAKGDPTLLDAGLWQNDGLPPIWSVDRGGEEWVPLGGASMPLSSTVGAGATTGPGSNVGPGAAGTTPAFDPSTLLGPAGGVRHYVSVRRTDTDPTVRSCTHVLRNDTPEVAVGVVFYLTYTRSQLLSVHTTHSAAVNRALQSGLGTAWQVSHPAWQVAPGGVLEVTFRFRGDPPHVRALTWLVEDREGVNVPPDLSSPPPPPPPFVYVASGDEQAEALSNFERTWDEEMALRLAKIEAPGATHVAHKRFFYDLDARTSPRAPLAPAQALDIQLLGGYLALQVFARAEVQHAGADPQVLSHSTESWRKRAPGVADLVRGILLEHYAGHGGGLDVAAVREAFLLFARGELGVLGTHGVPNGTNYFCFAELALLMVQLEHEVAVWRPLFAVFAETSEAYARSFHHCGRRRTTCAYGITGPEHLPRRWTRDQEKGLAAAWSGLTFEQTVERYAGVVQAALVDELSGPAASPPLPLPDVGCTGGLHDWPLRHRPR